MEAAIVPEAEKVEYIPDPEPDIPPEKQNIYQFTSDLKVYPHKNDKDKVYDHFPIEEFVVPYYKDKIIKNCEIGEFNINEKSGCFAMMACDASVGDENMETIYSQLLESEGYVFVGGGYMKETSRGPIFVEFEEGEGEFDVKIYINRDSDGIYDAKKRRLCR